MAQSREQEKAMFAKLGKGAKIESTKLFGLKDIPVGTKGEIVEHIDRQSPIVRFQGHEGQFNVGAEKLKVLKASKDFSELKQSEEAEKEAKELGLDRGESVANNIDIPEIGTKVKDLELEDTGFIDFDVIKNESDQLDASIMIAGEVDDNDRQFSPFEFTAKRLSELQTDEEGNQISDAFQVFEDAVGEGIKKGLKARFKQVEESSTEQKVTAGFQNLKDKLELNPDHVWGKKQGDINIATYSETKSVKKIEKEQEVKGFEKPTNIDLVKIGNSNFSAEFLKQIANDAHKNGLLQSNRLDRLLAEGMFKTSSIPNKPVLIKLKNTSYALAPRVEE